MQTVTHLDGKTKGQMLARLRSIEGHLRGIINMVEQDRYCIDVIKQTTAVEAALDRLNAMILERHLNHCVSTAIRSGTPSERRQAVSELLDIFKGRRAG